MRVMHRSSSKTRVSVFLPKSFRMFSLDFSVRHRQHTMPQVRGLGSRLPKTLSMPTAAQSQFRANLEKEPEWRCDYFALHILRHLHNVRHNLPVLERNDALSNRGI